MPQNDIRISKQLCKFCIRVLKNETHNIHAEEARQRKREKSLNELTDAEIISIAVNDKYFSDEHIKRRLVKKRLMLKKDLLQSRRPRCTRLK